MKEIIFKIFNPEVVDCSSTWSYLAPPIESIELLADIMLDLLQSDLIINIGKIELTLNYGENSPYTSYKSPNVVDKYFLDVLDYDLGQYDLHQGAKAEENKLNGLYIEKKEIAEVGIKEHQAKLDHKFPQKYKNLLLPSGIDGVREALMIIKNLNLGTEDCSIDFIMMYVDIIWKTWVGYFNTTSKKRIIFDLIRDDEEVLDSIDEVKDLDLNIRKKALNAFSHIGFEFQGGLGFNSKLSLGKDYTYITQKHYKEIVSFLEVEFGIQFETEFDYG